jgi:hypothetical protein
MVQGVPVQDREEKIKILLNGLQEAALPGDQVRGQPHNFFSQHWGIQVRFPLEFS